MAKPKVLKLFGIIPVSDPLKAVLSVLTKEEESRLIRIMSSNSEDLELDRIAGRNLLRLRKAFKISQQSMGKLLRVHQSAVSRIEKGEQTLSPAQFWVIETIFDIPPSQMLQELGEPEEQKENEV